MKNDLEKFVAKQIEELSEELVCPVCLEATTKPGRFGVLILSFKAWFWSSLITYMNLHVHAQQASFLNHTFIKGPVEQLLCLLYNLVERKGIRQFYIMFLKCSSKQICITDY